MHIHYVACDFCGAKLEPKEGFTLPGLVYSSRTVDFCRDCGQRMSIMAVLMKLGKWDEHWRALQEPVGGT